MKSYIKTQGNLFAFFNEYILLYKSLKKRSADAVRDADRIVNEYDNLARDVGRDLSTCDVLEVGVGQMPLRLAYLTSRAKSAIGLDLDVIAVKYSFGELIKTMRFNGLTRTLRTFGRQWLGLNNNLTRAFCARMGLASFPELKVLQGDICKKVPLENSSFDVIISTNVFEHLAHPERAAFEMARLLRPGGIVLVSTSHWAHCNAKHDLEVMYGFKPARWAHLRPTLEREVRQHAFVNELRMKDFKVLFSEYFDNTVIKGVPGDNLPDLRKELALARKNDELSGFLDEELLSDTCLVRAVGRG
jgi:SAM-dependent methyltransferase